MSMDIQFIDDVARKSLIKDNIAYKNIKSKYSTTTSIAEKMEDYEERKTSYDNIENSKDRKFNYANDPFESLSRKQRRRLNKEARFTSAIRDLSPKAQGKKAIKKLRNAVTSNISLPWIDSVLWSEFSGNLSNPLPRTKPNITRAEIEVSDQECCKDYLSPSRCNRNCWFTLFTVAACHAASDLGLYSFCEGTKRNLLPIALAVESTSKNTHSGTPLMVKKNDPFNISWTKKTLRDMFRKPSLGKVKNAFTNGLIVSEKGLTQSLMELPQMLFRRYQIGENPDGTLKIKPRVVWCIPHTVVALEAIFFHWAIDTCLNLSEVRPNYVYNIGQSNRRISDSLRVFKEQCSNSDHYSVWSLDYSKYDRTIPLWFFDIFFAIMESNIKMTTNEKQIYDNLRLYIKFTPMVVESGYTFKTKGISSGLFITNLLDTLFNLTLLKVTDILYKEDEKLFYNVVYSKKMVLNEKFNPKPFLHILSSYSYEIRVLGDDGVVHWPKIKVDFLSKLCFHLGMKLSIKHVCNNIKHDDIFYLGRYWDKNNIPDQSFKYMAAHIVFRSKFYNIKDINFSIEDLDAMRILSICLPLKSGKEFIDIYLKDYEPLQNFLKRKGDFYLLKEWPHEEYQRFKFDDIPSDVLDF